MSTVKIFILIVIAFVILAIFLIGPDPFSFGNAYFKPRSNSTIENPEPSVIILNN